MISIRSEIVRCLSCIATCVLGLGVYTRKRYVYIEPII